MDEQMKEQENTLTFSEIFRLLKKNWVVLVVSLLIGIILATSVLLVLREAIGTTNYETEITFSSASISEDKEFNPSTAVNTLIKSDTIISKALTNLGYSEDAKKSLYNEGLLEKLSAYASEAKTDGAGVSYPYKVTLSLNKLGNKVLSKAQSAALIEEITKQVVLELQSQYKKEISFDKLDAINYEKYNYLQAYDKLSGALDSVALYKESLQQESLEYEKQGISIKSALANFDAVKDDLMVIRSILVSNKYTNSEASSSELDYATYQYNVYSQKVTQLATRISDYAQLLKDTKPDITVMTGTVTIEALKSYYELVDRYNELQDEYTRLLEKAKEWEEIKDAYSSATTPTTAVQEQINANVDAYNNAYVALQGIVDSYNEDNYASSLVSETKTVKTVKDSAISALIIVLVEVVVIAVTMVVIVAVEKKKEEKENEAKQEVKA
ncbi:MAG: hypothetical protein E7338_02820 [Clostridiales bacterium]|nr:hypothetical protein [Clostridiales bacterium]